METVGEFFLTENVHLVLVVGGLGWILGICCLLLRYNDAQRPVPRPWVQRVCLLDDIMSKAFVSITVVGVVSLSIQVALNLPTLARTSDIPAEVDLGELTTRQENILQTVQNIAIPEPVDLTGVEAGQERILERVESILQANLISVLLDLVADQQLNDATLTEAVERTVGYPALREEWLLGYYSGEAMPPFECRPTDTDTDTRGWSCTVN